MDGNFRRDMKGSNINPSSCFAERELTLSEIDSRFQNGEIDKQEAERLSIQWAVDTDNIHLLSMLLGSK